MMDFCYYTTQVRDELDGACAYIRRATKCKATHPEWAALYAKMSDMELEHASNLMKIFEDDFKQNRTEDPIYDHVKASLTDMYTEFVAKVKYEHEVYSNMK